MTSSNQGVPLYDAEQVKAIEWACLSDLALAAPAITVTAAGTAKEGAARDGSGDEDSALGALIQRAARAIADEVETISMQLIAPVKIIALCGPGNNGQDARLALGLLRVRGFASWECSLVELSQIASIPSKRQDFFDKLTPHCIVIDGLFGIGLNRCLPPWLSQLIQEINAQGRHTLIAVDIPSGLCSATGTVFGACLRAHTTVTMLVDKKGLRTGKAAAFVGRIKLLSLDAASAISADARLLNVDWLAVHFKARSPLAHKGSHGSLLIVGGALGMIGAAILAAQAAQALGVGKVFVHLLGATENTYQQLSLVYPSLLAAPDPCADESLMKTLDCVLIGCGLGQGQASLDCFTKVLHQSKTYRFPLVIDADALNLLAVHRDRLSLLEAKDVITPHPLEAARLLGSTVQEVEANRFMAGRQLSQRYDCVSLLKGPGSVISPAPTQGAIQWVAPLGSPALAIGGSGDVLAGMIASLMAQSYDCSIATGIGVYLHAQTASKWSEMSGAHCALMVEHLPKLVNEYIAS